MLTEQELLLTKLSPSLDVWSSASDFFFHIASCLGGSGHMAILHAFL